VADLAAYERRVVQFAELGPLKYELPRFHLFKWHANEFKLLLVQLAIDFDVLFN